VLRPRQRLGRGAHDVLGLALGDELGRGVVGQRATGRVPRAGVAGPAGVVAAIALVVVFAFALSWAFTTLGLVMRAPNAVMNTGFMLLFPLTFLSNAFVEPSTLPAALEWFVDVNPISHVITAARGLMEGGATGGEIGLVLAEAAALTAIFAPLTTHLYRRA